MACMTECGSVRMVIVRVTSASFNGSSASKRYFQLLSQSSINSARVFGGASNSLSRLRSGFSPSVVRKSFQRERMLPAMCFTMTAMQLDSASISAKGASSGHCARPRKTLDRLPDQKWNWKPQDKSGTVGWLAGHIATMPGWITMTMQTEKFDYAPVGGAPYEPPKLENNKAILAEFDKGVAEARKAIADASDADMMKDWTLLAGGQTIFTMPRTACLRTMIFNHIIHHRAQLTVYYRLLGVS